MQITGRSRPRGSRFWGRLSKSQKFGRGSGFLHLKNSAAAAWVSKYSGRPWPRGLAAAVAQPFNTIDETMNKQDKCNSPRRMVMFKTEFEKLSHFWCKNYKKCT